MQLDLPQAQDDTDENVVMIAQLVHHTGSLDQMLAYTAAGRLVLRTGSPVAVVLEPCTVRVEWGISWWNRSTEQYDPADYWYADKGNALWEARRVPGLPSKIVSRRVVQLSEPEAV